jgi:hypothetical protein
VNLQVRLNLQVVQNGVAWVYLVDHGLEENMQISCPFGA